MIRRVVTNVATIATSQRRACAERFGNALNARSNSERHTFQNGLQVVKEGKERQEEEMRVVNAKPFASVVRRGV